MSSGEFQSCATHILRRRDKQVCSHASERGRTRVANQLAVRIRSKEARVLGRFSFLVAIVIGLVVIVVINQRSLKK